MQIMHWTKYMYLDIALRVKIKIYMMDLYGDME